LLAAPTGIENAAQPAGWFELTIVSCSPIAPNLFDGDDWYRSMSSDACPIRAQYPNFRMKKGGDIPRLIQFAAHMSAI
jgi:hypothetical protein